MMPLDSSVSGAAIWSITLESSITILQVSYSFDNCNIFIAKDTGEALPLRAKP